MKNVAVIGSQWGDEGKGKIVDWLSSAIATFYSCGKTLKKSCEMAIKYVNHSIGSGPNFGKGHGPINHLSTIKVNKKFK